MRLILIAAAVLLTGCGAMSTTQDVEAVRDFVAVEKLEQINNIRLYRQLRYGYVNDYFVIVNVMKRHYLVEFGMRCTALRSKV